MSSKSLIVGASGQVGHQIASILGSRNVFLSSRRPTGPEHIKVDLAELSSNPEHALELLEQLEPAVVYCVGGMTDVEACESQVELARLVNCTGPATLAAASRQFRVPFVYVSSEYVFDGREGPYDESDQPNPLSVYGRSKLAGELAIQALYPDALIVRTTVVYGPDPNEKNFVYQIQRASRLNRPVRIPVDQISSPTYGEDLAQGTIQLVVEKATGIYHVCGPEVISRYEFATTVAEALEISPSLLIPTLTSELKQRAQRPLRAGMKIDKLQSLLPDYPMRGTAEAMSAWKSLNVAKGMVA